MKFLRVNTIICNLYYYIYERFETKNLGIFESVIYGKADSLGGSSPKMEYFVPFIFLRDVEQQNGSGDNSMLGMELKWSIWKRIQLYGSLYFTIVREHRLLDSGTSIWQRLTAVNYHLHQVTLRHLSHLHRTRPAAPRLNVGATVPPKVDV